MRHNERLGSEGNEENEVSKRENEIRGVKGGGRKKKKEEEEMKYNEGIDSGEKMRIWGDN